MKKINKKTILSFSAIAVLAVPIGSVISCGSSGLDFDATKKDSAIMIVGGLGHKDKGFLQGAYDGIMKSKKSIANFKKYGEIKIPDSAIPTAKEGTNKALQAGGYAIIGVGFQYPTFFDGTDFGKKYPDREFIGLDGLVTDSNHQLKVPHKNVTSIAFKAEQSSFLVGVATGLYLAKNYDKYKGDGGLSAGGFGGQSYSTVTDMLAGYIHGLSFYNSNLALDKDHKVKFMGWNGEKNGFSGGFVPDSRSISKANSLLAANVDVVYPVAGGQVNSMVDAIKNKSLSNTKVIGVDSDQSKVFGEDGSLFITSALKSTEQATLEALKAIYGITGAKISKGANNIKGLADGFVGMAEGVFGSNDFKGTNFTRKIKTDGGIDTSDSKSIYEQIQSGIGNKIFLAATSASKNWDKAKVIFGASSDKIPELNDFI